MSTDSIAECRLSDISLLLASLAIVTGVYFLLFVIVYSNGRLEHANDVRDHQRRSIIQMDAINYKRIIRHGYSYSNEERSTVAFFPCYPLFCYVLTRATGLHVDASMILVSSLSMVLAAYVLAVHCRDSIPTKDSSAPKWTLLLFCIWPATMFFYSGYAESLFAFYVVAFVYGLKRKWPFWALAIVSGFATATRPVGVALSLALLWHALFVFKDTKSRNLSPLNVTVVKMIAIALLSCFGIVCYSVYLWFTFGNPIAYADAQRFWNYHSPGDYTLGDKMCSLVTLEPIYNTYNANSDRYWARVDGTLNPIYSQAFWNPIFYCVAWLLLLAGYMKKWLSETELVLNSMILIIPYITRGYEMSMASHARFASVAISQFIVLGRFVSLVPPVLGYLLCVMLGVLMSIWSAFFMTGDRYF